MAELNFQQLNVVVLIYWKIFDILCLGLTLLAVCLKYLKVKKFYIIYYRISFCLNFIENNQNIGFGFKFLGSLFIIFKIKTRKVLNNYYIIYFCLDFIENNQNAGFGFNFIGCL